MYFYCYLITLSLSLHHKGNRVSQTDIVLGYEILVNKLISTKLKRFTFNYNFRLVDINLFTNIS
jgi:hypothetical protein